MGRLGSVTPEWGRMTGQGPHSSSHQSRTHRILDGGRGSPSGYHQLPGRPLVAEQLHSQIAGQSHRLPGTNSILGRCAAEISYCQEHVCTDVCAHLHVVHSGSRVLCDTLSVRFVFKEPTGRQAQREGVVSTVISRA